MDPQKIGRYEIKAELGRGGMATVYQAYDPRFEREVAIKVLPREMLHDPQFRVRFEREAKTIAMLEHPAIVPVYDFGEEDGQPYFVMRYMTGGSLSDRLKKGPVSIAEAARLFERLAPALDEAHVKGIIHRDLKPGNILFDQYNEPYISDFGIAKLSEAQTNVTGSAIVGTPAYMSPEQAQGETIDGRSDIYGMGIILFEMLTGSQPYQGDTPMSVVVKHITDPVPHILDVKPDLPPATESVIAKAMAKNRDERFPTVKALADALSAVARGETSDLVTVAAGERADLSRTIIAGHEAELAGTVRAKRDKETKAPQVGPARSQSRMWIGIGAGAFLVLAAAAAGILLFRSGPPLQAVPTQTKEVVPGGTAQQIDTSTLAFTQTQNPSYTPSETPATSSTPTTSTVGAPTLGGSDLVAFLSGNNIWVMNVDGSNLRQLTSDQAAKHDLQWMADRDTLLYISDKCILTVSLTVQGLPNTITCFPEADFLDAFRISPDGKHVAISLNRQLFVVPFDLPTLEKAQTRSQLTSMSPCFTYNAQNTDQSTEDVSWSGDSSRIAVGIIGVDDTGRAADMVKVFDVSICNNGSTPVKSLDLFPRSPMTGYSENPVIPGFDWNNSSLILLNTLIRNQAYGYQFSYNLDTHRTQQLDPLGTGCCYADMHWSPDGNYVIFGYQNLALGSSATTQLYLVPYGTLGAGGSHTPFALPAGFFSNPHDHPDAELRPAAK